MADHGRADQAERVLLRADPLTRANPGAFQRLGHAARHLRASATMCLHLGLHDVRGLGDGAGVATFIVDADFALH